MTGVAVFEEISVEAIMAGVTDIIEIETVEMIEMEEEDLINLQEHAIIVGKMVILPKTVIN